MSKNALIVFGIVAAAILLPAGCGISSYNGLVSLDQQVQSQWAQVENVYQRRLDLVPKGHLHGGDRSSQPCRASVGNFGTSAR